MDGTSAIEGAIPSRPKKGMMVDTPPMQGSVVPPSQSTNESQPAVKDEKEDVLEDEDMTKGDVDDEGPAQPQTTAEKTSQRRKMKGFRLTHQQTRFLMSEFAKQPYPDAAHRERLSREIPGLSPWQVAVWFQNRRAKIKPLTADDRDRMVKLRAVPEDFDNVQALHSPYGAVHGLLSPITSSADFGSSSYTDQIMRPLMVDMRRRKGNGHLSPTGRSPVSGSIDFNPSATLSTSDILSPLSASFDIEELSDFADSDGGRLGVTRPKAVIRPEAIELTESYHGSRSRSLAPEFMDSELFSKFKSLSCSDATGTKTDEAEYQELLCQRQESKRNKRMTSGPVGKRTINEPFGSDTDWEDLRNPLSVTLEGGSSARRRPNRVVHRRGLLFDDPPPKLLEPDESSSSDDEVDVVLARELPYYEYAAMGIDSDSDVGIQGRHFRRPSRKLEREPKEGEEGDPPERFVHACSGTDTDEPADARLSMSDKRKSSFSAKGHPLEAWGIDSDQDADNSDASEVESIMSEAPSVASSRSSVPMDVDVGAIDEFASLLLMNPTLESLYEVAISKVGPEKFRRNFRRLLLRYGRALSVEATTTLQTKAARFVRFTASRVSAQIKDSVVNNSRGERGKNKHSTKALGTYLKHIQDVDDASSEDVSDHDPDEASLRTLDGVKNFMVSSAAFSSLCRSLRIWLNLEDQDEQAAAQNQLVTEAGDKESVSVNALTELPNQQSSLPLEEFTISVASKTITTNAAPAKTEGPLIKSKQTTSPLRAARAVSKHCWNRLSSLWQASVPPGQVRVSWICRCGDILRIQVPVSQQCAATALARLAAGPNADTIIAEQSSSRPRPSFTPSNIQTSTSTDTTTDASSTGETSRSSAGSRPHSPNTVPSSDELSQPEPFTPAGTKKFMLLCVNTSGPRGLPQRKLANVDVTDVECGAEMFQRLRDAYYTLRGSRNPLLVPKTMHYVKFQLLFLQKSGECIGSYQVNSIPSRNEVLKQEYAFSPCPPHVGPLPLPPDIFMHGFLDPGDHLGPMAVDILPKKLWCQLRWDARANDRYNIPAGWGFYIVEGINWPVVSWGAALVLLGVTILTAAWSVWAEDVQGGTGLGQYCLAVLTLSVSVWLLKYSVRDGMS